MDQQFTVTVTAYCLGLKMHIRNVTVLKTYIRILKIFLKKYHLVKCAVNLKPVYALSRLMSLLCVDRIIVMVKL
jgi:hypothetical protein